MKSQLYVLVLHDISFIHQTRNISHRAKSILQLQMSNRFLHLHRTIYQ